MALSDYSEKDLKRHLKANAVRSLDAYLGKEHFWQFGESAGIRKRDASALFTILLSSVRLDIDARVIPGIVVAKREDVELPFPPPVQGLRSQTESLSDPRKPDPLYFAVQARGVVDLSKDERSVLNYPSSSVGTQRALSLIGSQLEEQIVSFTQPRPKRDL
jgi:hypothetical protein